MEVHQFDARAVRIVKVELAFAIHADLGVVFMKYVSDSGEVSDTAPERKAMVPPAPIEEVFDPLTRLTQRSGPEHL